MQQVAIQTLEFRKRHRRPAKFVPPVTKGHLPVRAVVATRTPSWIAPHMGPCYFQPTLRV